MLTRFHPDWPGPGWQSDRTLARGPGPPRSGQLLQPL